MIEMLGVLAIIGVLSAGGIMGYSVAMENYRVNKHFSVLKQVAMNAKTVFNRMPTADSNTGIPQLNNAGILVADYPKSKSVWNTAVGMGVHERILCSASGGLNIYVDGDLPCTYIYTTVFDVSESVCRKLLTFDIKNFFPEFNVFVATGSYTNGLPYTDTPVTLERATAICASKQSRSAYIVWRFYWNARFLDRPN